MFTPTTNLEKQSLSLYIFILLDEKGSILLVPSTLGRTQAML